MPKLITSLSLTILFSFHFLGCGSSTQNPTTPNNMGTLKISLTDAPAAVDAVNITFSEVSAHIDGNWITLSDQAQTVNLLDFSNGKTTEIGSADVPVGQYTQIRLIIAEAEVVVDGITHAMTVPSGAQTGLKLITQFTIVAGSTVELIVDFDVSRSVVTTGPPSQPKSYRLKPTLRVISRAVTGSISGRVTNPQHLPVAYALAGSDTVTSTFIDQNSGEFMLAFLPDGSYTVSLRDTMDYSLEMNDVQVTAGTDQALGELTLPSSSGTQTGTLRISLTDAPGDFDAVNITFAEISAHLDNRWITVNLDTMTVNLLEFSNGRTVEIGSADVPVGQYTQIRIKIIAAEVVVDGQTKEMKVPSGAQSGLKLGPPFTVAEGSTMELMLDFDANRSVVVTGPPDNPKKYLLKPRLRLISKDLTGSISATVTNPEHLPTAFAIAGADTVTSTLVDKDSGGFMLAFLPEGLYTVSVRDTLDQFFTSTAVEVIAGRDNALSSITLSK